MHMETLHSTHIKDYWNKSAYIKEEAKNKNKKEIMTTQRQSFQDIKEPSQMLLPIRLQMWDF